jgi:hypothetical protein
MKSFLSECPKGILNLLDVMVFGKLFFDKRDYLICQLHGGFGGASTTFSGAS